MKAETSGMESNLKLWLQAESVGFQSKPINSKQTIVEGPKNKIFLAIKLENNEAYIQKNLNHHMVEA